MTANTSQPGTSTPSSAPKTATPAVTVSTCSSAATLPAAATRPRRVRFDFSTADTGAPIPGADGLNTSNEDQGDSDSDDVINNSERIVAASSACGIDRGDVPTPAEDIREDDNVHSKASDGAYQTSTTAAPALVPLASPPEILVVAQNGHIRGGSSRLLPFRPARRRSPGIDYSLSYPPCMPPPVQRARNPIIAALEPAFAAHLRLEAPGADRRVRFSPESLWEYMCYCFGYEADDELRGGRAHMDRRAALIYYVLRSDADDDDDEDDDDDDDNHMAACSSSSKNESCSGKMEPGGTGTLWIKARGGAPSGPVVSTDDIVATVMRVHRELGHTDAGATNDTVARSLFGVTKGDVKWVVDSCPDCRDRARRPWLSLRPSSSPSSTPASAPHRLVGGRGPARECAPSSAAPTGDAEVGMGRGPGASSDAGEACGSQGSNDARYAGMKRKRT